MKKNMFDARTITKIGLLMALDIILTRFVSIETPIVRISFGFLPSALIAMMFGPWVAGTAGALTDLLGFFLFSRGGVFFPGFTLSAFLGGAIYGLILYRKPKTLARIVLAVVLVTIIVNLGLNTLWLTILYEEAVFAILPVRVIQNLVLAPVRILMIYFVVKNQTIRKTIGI